MSRDLKGELLIAQKINDFVTFRSAPICDRCISAGLGLTTLAHSAQITAALGTTSDFKRKTGICSVCKNERIVIHATRKYRAKSPEGKVRHPVFKGIREDL
jgi:hypothetical protein